jgi:hypothetical protein
MHKRALAISFFAVTALPAAARADILQPGANSVGSITRIGRGVKELSLESQVVVGFRSDAKKGSLPEASTTNLALLGGAVFRYFVADNVMLGLHAGGFFRDAKTKAGDSESDARELGFLGTLSAAYYASLGGGMFITPLVGAGGFVGSSTATTPGVGGADDLKTEASISGFAARGGLGFVFYPSTRFNLFARPEAVAYFGSSKPKDTGDSGDDAKSRGFTRIDGGFTCGLSYVF